MSKLPFFLVILTILVLTEACAPVDPASVPSGSEIRDASPDHNPERKLGDAFLKMVQANNYSGFHALLAKHSDWNLTQKDFNTSRKAVVSKFGEIHSWRFLTNLETPMIKNLVWAVMFERKNASGAVIRNEVLFRLVTGVKDGKTEVFGLGFF